MKIEVHPGTGPATLKLTTETRADLFTLGILWARADSSTMPRESDDSVDQMEMQLALSTLLAIATK